MFGYMKVKEHEEEVASYERRIKIFLREYDRLEHENRKLRKKLEELSTSKLDTTNLRRLIQLCHPDKHGGSELSVKMTHLLVKMKDNS